MTLFEALYACAVALWIFLAALGFGGLTLRLLRIEDRGLGWLWLATTCGLGLLSVSTLLLGLMGLLYAWLFAILLVPLGIVGIAFIVQQRMIWEETGRWLTWQQDEWPFRIGAYLLLLISVTTVLWIMLTHALMPPHDWDEVAYHMTLAKMYTDAQAIIYVPFIVPSNWPMNSQMLFVIGLLFGSDLAAHLITLGITVLVALGLLIIGRRYFDDPVGIVAAAIFLTVPLVKRISGSALIDVTIGMYILAGLIALIQWQHTRRWTWLFLGGMFAGFAAGSKLMGGGFPILLGLIVVAVELFRRPFHFGSVIRSGVIFGMAGLLVAGPWYGRSFLFTGNPIWPFAYHVFGGRDWDLLGDEYHMSLLIDVWSVYIPRTLVGLFQSFVYMFLRPEEMGGYRAGLGIIAPFGALLALLAVWRAPRFLQQSLFVCFGFYLLWFALVSHQLRYLLPIVPLMALASAYLIIRFYERVRSQPLQILLMGVLIGLLLQQWPWVRADERALFASRTSYLTGELSRDDWLDTQIDVMPLFRYANSELPESAKVLLLPYENRTYYLDRDYIWGHPISQRVIQFERFETVGELETHLRQKGITHVIHSPSWMFDGIRYWDHIYGLMVSLRDECGEPLVQTDEAILYKLNGCSQDGALGSQ
ncbi:MAG: hypothetical protein AAGF95_13700 [Chloroflexota bacterium]